MWAIKHALNTTKVGHTGTLDNFADGLLVVLTNRMRKFVAYVTDFDKTYEAIIKFGSETDTLDRTGEVIASGPLPDEASFRKAVASYTGAIEQVPPVYSAIQVKGRRASDLVRSGKDVSLPPRSIIIHSNEIIDFTGEYAHIRVSCSKGTYVRALARDLASLCESKAHLVALRRTKVGTFSLENAAGYSLLPEFSIANLENLTIDKVTFLPPEEEKHCIQKAVFPFTPETAQLCGLKTIFVHPEWFEHFLCGKPLRYQYFVDFPLESREEIVVFAQTGTVPRLCGLVKRQSGGRIKYIFVIQDDLPPDNPVRRKKMEA